MVDDDPDTDRLLESVADEDCRAILAVTAEPRTAPEISEECDIPLSTAYRKVDHLTDLSLLESRVRIDATGRHPTQYRRRIAGLVVQFGPGEAVSLSVVDDGEASTRDDRKSPTTDGGTVRRQQDPDDGDPESGSEDDRSGTSE